MNCLLIYCTINWLFLWWHIFCYFTYWFFHEFILKNHKNGLWNLKKIQICLIFAYRVICITRRIKGGNLRYSKDIEITRYVSPCLVEQTAVQQLFHPSHQNASVKEQISLVVQLITTTVHQIHTVFYSPAEPSDSTSHQNISTLINIYG